MVTNLKLTFEIDVEKIMKAIAKKEDRELCDIEPDDVFYYLNDILEDKVPFFRATGFSYPSDGNLLHSVDDEIYDEIYDIKDKAYDAKEAEEALGKPHKQTGKDDI